VSQENVDLMRRYFDAWNAGDTDTVIAALATDVEWHGHPVLPEPGPYYDREAVRRWMDQFREAWDELKADPVEMIDAGDNVVVLVHMTGRGRGSGVEVRGGVDVHLATFRGGEVVYYRIYQGDLAAQRTALSERERELLVAKVQDGLSEAEIADRLGIDAAEAASTFESAVTKLREIPADAPGAAQPG
jgi:uncharacterized protein